MEAFLLFFFYCFCLDLSAAFDTITASQFMGDPAFIVSNSGNFKLGFFSPLNSTNRYVGIWYNVPVPAPIWVANRNTPLHDSSGVVRISDDGKLVILSGQQEILWSSNVGLTGNSIARLTDDGNLVLQDAFSGNTIWESFQYPMNVFVEKMKLSANERTGKMTLLTSWLSDSDPSVGSFSCGVNPSTVPEVFIWNESRPMWRSGPWDGKLFNGLTEMKSGYLDGFNLVEDEDATTTLSYSYSKESFILKYVLTPQGGLMQSYWDDGNKDWVLQSFAPESFCDVYGICGAYGSCNIQSSPPCSCLKGFEPKFADDWNGNNWTSGCVRRRSLECTFLPDIGRVDPRDGFLKLEKVKLPDFAQWSSSDEYKCRVHCWYNCSCIAYSYHSGIGCMSWTGELIDIQQFSSGGADLYIRISSSELDGNKEKKVIIITVTVSLGAATIAIVVFFSWRWMAKYKEKRRKSGEVSSLEDKMDDVKLQELPLFSLQKLVAATEKFRASNKIGQGGFGPVYRGKLQDGREIAVKRLSTASGQGIQEFMNEVVVISKLQHRNLVRLLGCCVEGEEKMLVYEYMPNKSLDAFLFGPRKQELLDWTRRFNIVEGICRGLLYLHRDSRLRIIHRDLKASNILLDHELNPRISDFGMARIVRGDRDQADTRRVVGTYGYMAPEYAMEGRFSEKSDVFSFGVVLLEIISGRRNTSFYGDEQALSLLAYAWKLWSEDNVAALVDPAILDPSFRLEILRCIHVGLLCVQEFARDRPSMSTVISMLNSEIADLPTPKQPAFTERHIALGADSSHQGSDQKCSVNDVTVTILEGR